MVFKINQKNMFFQILKNQDLASFNNNIYKEMILKN